MGLEQAGNVIYFGFFASFFGGWVPVRSKNIKLAVFHLYLFLSMLVFPLVIYLVDSTRLAGWIVYGVFIAISFSILKITNFRLHKALGSDPPPPTPSHSDSTPSLVDSEDRKEENVKVGISLEEGRGGGEEEDKLAEVAILNEDEDINRHRSSASTLNEGSSLHTNPNTPDIELSQISQPLTESTAVVPMETNTESDESVPAQPLDSNPESSADGINERTPSSGSRQRVCHRSLRQNSRSSCGGREQVDISDPHLEAVREHLKLSRHSQLADVVNKMPPQVLEAIILDDVPSEALDSLVDRIGQLRNGHLASGDDDNSPGAIHWIADDYEFYVFNEAEQEEDNSSEVLAALQFDEFRQFHDTLANEAITPRDVPNNVEDNKDTAPPDAPPIPCIFILPKIAKTKVILNFTRRQLEEYMDRNVSRLEVLCAILLAVMVCVIGALLFTVTDFYNGFWVFALCFVIATVHFSLIKSVQSDPASPSPGQNRINAMSRAGYFIVVGSLGLLLNGILEHTDSYSPACLYGFNYNNPLIIRFARDGLFIFILFIPVLFTLGWMPQCDTFLINVLEHIDIHVFGGTASTGLVCSLYSLMRNAMAVLCLLPLGYVAFIYLETEPDYVGSDCSMTFYNYHDNQNASTILSQECTNGGRVGLSFFLGGVVMTAYALSRSTTNHQYIVDIIHYCYKKILYKCHHTHNLAPPIIDPLEEMYRKVMSKRLLVDIMICILLMVTVTVLNLTSVFCQTEILAYIVYGITALLGVVNHYLLPHARKEMPYLCFSKPCITSKEYDEFEVTEEPQVSLVEQILQVTLFLEKNIFYPLTFLFGLNIVAVYYRAKFGEVGAAFVVSIVGIKLFRSAYSELSRQHIILILSLLFFNVDYAHLNEGLPFNYFIIAILFSKIYELYLKVYFILIYIMPGSWSSPFHIIIQPLLIPHCPLIFFETLVGAIMNAPMNPVIASSMFFLSYARPIKFWEKDYNTKRRDTSNTRLEQQLDTNIRNPNPDHLDSLFYEQLSWSLQRDLCGDIMLGRWGRVTSGDFFILTNDQLNALVHIIEIGNGFVTFQLRGLEFRGTYCHQREREAITEPLADEDSCCYQPPGLLACNKVLSARWIAWEVVSSSYTLHGYSISENPAHSVFNAYDFKKTFITNYVKCIIYYLFKYPRLPTLLCNIELQESLAGLTDPDSVEYDSLFDSQRNTDCINTGGISRRAFVNLYFDFISTCASKFPSVTVEVDTSPESFLVTLCFAYSLLGRRLFFTHSSTGSGRRGGDNFMHGLYRMFLGDARPSNEKDDWIFMDVDSIQQVIIPAVRTAFKVHQDNFTYSNELVDSEGMYDAIEDTDANHIVTHENDRLWRDGVVLNRPSLLALRYQRTEDSYNHPYKIIRLTSKFIKFRVVKVNKECVRSLWSSQQHELIFLRNSDSERGSIQNHKASLRNMINSSMDLPIGYPIFVSPLQTSFIDRHKPFHESLVGRCINPDTYINGLKKLYTYKCCKGSGGGVNSKPIVTKSSPGARLADSTDSLTGGRPPVQVPYEEEDSDDDDVWKPIWVGKQVGVTNLDEVFYTFNEGWLKWPEKAWYNRVTQWGGWSPSVSTQGEVIHEWRPFHVKSTSRSHIDKLIVLVQTNDGHLVLIKEQGIQEI